MAIISYYCFHLIKISTKLTISSSNRMRTITPTTLSMIELGFAIAEVGEDNIIIVLGVVVALHPVSMYKSAEFKGHHASITHIIRFKHYYTGNYGKSNLEDLDLLSLLDPLSCLPRKKIGSSLH